MTSPDIDIAADDARFPAYHLDRLVGKVDATADRKAGVIAAFGEVFRTFDTEVGKSVCSAPDVVTARSSAEPGKKDGPTTEYVINMPEAAVTEESRHFSDGGVVFATPGCTATNTQWKSSSR